MADEERLSDNLLPASFRDVPFHVGTHDLGAGRRVQVHEYPQRDKPFVEDLGRATRELEFTAVLVGEDYVDQVNALLKALETPGPGTLVHPWLGEMEVALKDKGRVSFDSGLGKATLQLSFVESGELEFPTAATSTQQASRNAASALEQSAVDAFIAQFSVKGFQDFVTAAATGNLGNVLGIVSRSEVGKLLGFANGLANTISTVVALVTYPSSLGFKLMSMFGLSGLATTVAAWSNIVRQLSRTSKSSSMKSPKPSRTWTPSRHQADNNAAALYALCRQAMLVQAVGASSLVDTKVDAASSPVVSYGEMIGVRDELVAAIDAESLTATDGVYDALQAARAAVWQDLTTRARNNARLDTLTPPEVLPALVVSYDYYGDATRDAELVARNRVRHPGFVPALPIKVLTK